MNRGKAKPKRSRARRVLLGVVLLLVISGLLLGVVGFRLWQLWSTVPEFAADYQTFRQRTPEPELTAMAATLETGLVPAWSAPIGRNTGDGVRTVEASFEQINAWLAVRLPAYLKNQGAPLPEAVKAVMVTERDGRLVVAVDYDGPELSQLLSVYLTFEDPPADAAGAAAEGAYLRVDRVLGGRLRLPVQQLVGLVRSQMPIDDPGVDGLLSAVEAGRPVGPLVLPVDGRRRARLLGVDAADGSLRVTVEVFEPGDEAPDGSVGAGAGTGTGTGARS